MSWPEWRDDAGDVSACGRVASRRVGKKGGIGEGAKGACGRIGVFERGTQLGIVRPSNGASLG